MIALADVARREDAQAVADKLLAALLQPFSIDGEVLRVSASVGISVYPDDAGDPSGLLRAADTAMYRAKRSGRGVIRLFTPDLSVAGERWHILSHDISGACDRGEFELYYQPQIGLRDRSIVGVEALLRWNHPTLGIVCPELFVPLLEERGMMVDVGRWVLEEACRQNKRWQLDGLPPVRVGVNLSAQQFYRDDIVETVRNALASCDLAPQWLELELTESLTLDDAESTLRIMSALKTLGVALSLDDFGTGWSSLSYLRRFPLDRIKIDRSFIRDLAHHESTAAIVHAILELARRLGLDCVAEGVETEEQQGLLLQELCPNMQGYLFSKPVPAADLGQLMRAHPYSGATCAA